MAEKEFRPAWSMPMNYEQALAVLEYWGATDSYTFSTQRARRCAEIMAYTRGVWVDEQVRDDRTIADKVNELTKVAVQYGGAQQLRMRVADVIVPHLVELKELRAELKELRARMEGLEK